MRPVYRFEAKAFFPVPDGLDTCRYRIAATTPVVHSGAFDVRLPQWPTAATLRIAVSSDSQGGGSVWAAVLETLVAQRPDLHIVLGDVVQTGWRIDEWATSFVGPLAHADSFGSRVPQLLVRGNHDVEGPAPLRAFFGDRRPPYHALTLASAFVMVLDSNSDHAEEQTNWIEAQLNSPAAQIAPFRIVLVHVPPFIEYWDPVAWQRGERRWGAWVRERWAPLFERGHVDIVLSGHQHNYQRGARNGTVYVVAGGGGGGDTDKARVEDYGLYTVTRLEPHGGVLELSSRSLRWTALSPAGRVLDTFEIPKRPAV